MSNDYLCPKCGSLTKAHIDKIWIPQKYNSTRIKIIKFFCERCKFLFDIHFNKKAKIFNKELINEHCVPISNKRLKNGK